MTNSEATIAVITIPGYSVDGVEKALLDNGLVGTDTYVIANEKAIDYAAIEVLYGMLALASVSEGGYSIGYSTEGILVRLGILNNKYGLGFNNKVQNASYYW